MRESTSRWRDALGRGSVNSLVPVVIGLAWLVIVELSAWVTPHSVRSEVTQGVAAALLIVGYWLWPKPTLMVFAFAMSDGANARLVNPTSGNGAALTLTLSTLAVQATQTSGSTQTVAWAYIRIG